MIGFNHTLAGVLVGATVSPVYIPVVALFSHFVMDALPHFGKSITFTPYTRPFKALLLLDALACFAVLGFGWWVFPEHRVAVTIGAIFATLPDFLWILEHKVKWLQPYFTFAKKIQWAETPNGWTYELLFFCLFALALVLVA